MDPWDFNFLEWLLQMGTLILMVSFVVGVYNGSGEGPAVIVGLILGSVLLVLYGTDPNRDDFGTWTISERWWFFFGALAIANVSMYWERWR